MGHKKSKETFSYLESERIEKYAHDDNERALLSHWLHLRLSRYCGVYEPFARQMLSNSGLFDDLISFGSETRETCRQDFFPEIFDVPFPPPTHPRFSFIDLFAGIGGFRLAMQACGGECCTYLKKACSSIKFHGYQSKTFSDNLLLIDDGLPRIVAALVFARYFGDSNDYSCKNLLEIVKKQNPCGYHAAATGFYESKVSRFLEAVALGMKPSQSWGGETDATGGYLIVKRDGDLIAFYIYNRDRFKHYLVHNTFLEIASSTRHGFMEVYQDTTGRNLIKLNLQIRFN